MTRNWTGQTEHNWGQQEEGRSEDRVSWNMERHPSWFFSAISTHVINYVPSPTLDFNWCPQWLFWNSRDYTQSSLLNVHPSTPFFWEDAVPVNTAQWVVRGFRSSGTSTRDFLQSWKCSFPARTKVPCRISSQKKMHNFPPDYPI